MKALATALLVVAAAALASSTAAAADPAKRPVQDYDGRPDAPTDTSNALLVAPRVLFAPIYLATEYLVRRPVGAAVIEAERADLPHELYDFFTFGPDHKAGFIPTAFVDFGFNPSVGVYAFWDDAFFRGDDLRLHASAWNSDWLAGSLVQRVRFHAEDTFTLKVAGMRRPDFVFYGVGPRTLDSNQGRYGEDQLEASATSQFALWRASKVEAGIGLRRADFRDGHYGTDAGIVERVQGGAYALPDGFAAGYTAEINRLHAALDSRRPSPDDGSGLRLEGELAQGSDMSRTSGARWIQYEAGVGAFEDLGGHRRVLSESVTARFADPLGHGPVPFTELVSLGGDGPMPGFFPGRLVDRSAAVAKVAYSWPIGPWVDGTLQAAVGNVFGERLSGFDPRLLRFSGAIGIQTDTSPDSNFQLLVGLGTETFDRGAQIDSVRLVLGISRGL